MQIIPTGSFTFSCYCSCREVSPSRKCLRWVLGNEVINREIVWHFTPDPLNESWMDSQRHVQDLSQRVCRASGCCQVGGGASDEMAAGTEKGKFKNTKSSLVLGCEVFRNCWETGTEMREIMTERVLRFTKCIWSRKLQMLKFKPKHPPLFTDPHPGSALTLLSFPAQTGINMIWIQTVGLCLFYGCH